MQFIDVGPGRVESAPQLALVNDAWPLAPPPDHFRILFVHCDFQRNVLLGENVNHQRRLLQKLKRELNAAHHVFDQDYASIEEVDLNAVDERNHGEQMDEIAKQFNGAGKGFDLIHVCTHGMPNGLFLKDSKVDSLDFCEQVFKSLASGERPGAVLVLACCDSETLAKRLLSTDRFYAVFGTRTRLKPATALEFLRGLYGYLASSWTDRTDSGSAEKRLVRACLGKGLQLGRNCCEHNEKQVWDMVGNTKRERLPFEGLIKSLRDIYCEFQRNFFNPPHFAGGVDSMSLLMEQNSKVVVLQDQRNGKGVGGDCHDVLEGGEMNYVSQTIGEWIGYCRHVDMNVEDGAKFLDWLNDKYDIVMAVTIADLEKANLSLETLLKKVFFFHDQRDYYARELRGYSSRVLWVVDAMEANPHSSAQKKVLRRFSRVNNGDLDAVADSSVLGWMERAIIVSPNLKHKNCLQLVMNSMLVDNTIIDKTIVERMEAVKSIHSTWKDGVASSAGSLALNGEEARGTEGRNDVPSSSTIEPPVVAVVQSHQSFSTAPSHSFLAKAWEEWVLQLREDFFQNPLVLFKGSRNAIWSNRVIPYVPVKIVRNADSEEITISELITSNRRRVLLEGVTGAGKSTVMRRIFQLWFLRKAYHQFQLIIPMQLSDLSRLKDWDIGTVLPLCKITEKSLIDAIRRRDIRVLFILDGLDEVEHNVPFEKQFLDPLFSNTLDSSLDWIGDVIITSRPGLTNKFKCDGMDELSLMGFDKAGKDLYIDHYFAEKPMVERLRIKKLVNESVFSGITDDPLMLQLVCFSCLEAPVVGRQLNVTIVFEKAVHQILTRALQELNVNAGSTEGKNLSSAYMSAMTGFVSQHGWSRGWFSEQRASQVFEKSCTKFNCSKLWTELLKLSLELGILRRERSRPANLQFAHQAFQEYFYALYLVKLFISDPSAAKNLVSSWLAINKSLDGVSVVLLFLSQLLEQKRDVASISIIGDLVNKHVSYPSHALVTHNLVVIMDVMIQKKKFNLREKNELDQPLLFSCDNVATMGFLLDCKAELEGKDTQGFTRLHYACVCQQVEIVSFLIERGANVNTKDAEGLTPLYWAYQFGNISIVRLLLGGKAKVDTRSGLSPLYLACDHLDKKQSLEIVRFLVEERMQPIVNRGKMDGNEHGVNVFHLACKNGNIELMRYLLQRGANAYLLDKLGRSALHFAAQSDSLIAVEFLISLGMNKSVADENGELPIHFACKGGALDVISFFKDDLASVTKDGRNCLHFAAEHDNVLAVKFLVSLGTLNVNQRDKNKKTPLDYASMSEERFEYRNKDAQSKVQTFLEENGAIVGTNLDEEVEGKKSGARKRRSLSPKPVAKAKMTKQKSPAKKKANTKGTKPKSPASIRSEAKTTRVGVSKPKNPKPKRERSASKKARASAKKAQKTNPKKVN